jgi:hypothetical protein
MNLSVLERIITLSVLPKEGDYATLRILQNLRMSLAFTEEEVKEWSIVSQDGRTTWAMNGETDIPIGEKATDIIVHALKHLDKEKKLIENAMSVYEKFIPVPD